MSKSAAPIFPKVGTVVTQTDDGLYIQLETNLRIKRNKKWFELYIYSSYRTSLTRQRSLAVECFGMSHHFINYVWLQLHCYQVDPKIQDENIEISKCQAPEKWRIHFNKLFENLR